MAENAFHPRLNYLFKHSDPINFWSNIFRAILVLAVCRIKEPGVTRHTKTRTLAVNQSQIQKYLPSYVQKMLNADATFSLAYARLRTVNVHLSEWH